MIIHHMVVYSHYTDYNNIAITSQCSK